MVNRLANMLHTSPPALPFIRESDFAPRKPWSYAERRLLDYLFVYIQEGECLFTVDKQPYALRSGQFCLIQPGSLVQLAGLTTTITPFAHLDFFYNPHRERSFPTRPGQIDLSAYAELMQPRLEEVYNVHIPIVLQPLHPSKFKEDFLRMIELSGQQDDIMQLRVQQLATELLVQIVESCAVNRGTPPIRAQSLGWITSYLSLHLDKPISIEVMAKRAGLSPSRFSALFKERYGTSPHQYLLQMRINHAKELLDRTELSQEEVAAYCGFADVHHYYKIFKQRAGLTPAEWRRQQQEAVRRL
ncbi:helix-turn-helix domain-containing protein [Paenibacillus sp. GCM10023252]|uniref:AraC family transcriptional regulator n=1 Tax=Paenibacillus sp. GCM10023252 TaxID=3252649 RepID=UPI00361B5F65